MIIKDYGIIISKKELKEEYLIIAILTSKNGLLRTVVKNVKKTFSIYQIGNLIEFIWQARLSEHLGSAKCGLIKSYIAVLMNDKNKLYAFNSIINIIEISFHEREDVNNFFLIFYQYINNLAQNFVIKQYIDFELKILEECGYGITLQACAVSQETKNLYYVSPKSGSAISYEVGKQYKEKLLILPQFLLNNNISITAKDLKNAFNLTSYFFNRYIIKKQQILKEREKFITHLISLYN